MGNGLYVHTYMRSIHTQLGVLYSAAAAFFASTLTLLAFPSFFSLSLSLVIYFYLDDCVCVCAPVTIRRPISPLARATVSSIRTSTRFLQNGPPSFSLKHATGSLPTLSLPSYAISLSALLLLLLFPLVDPVFLLFFVFSLSRRPCTIARSNDF